MELVLLQPSLVAAYWWWSVWLYSAFWEWAAEARKQALEKHLLHLALL